MARMAQSETRPERIRWRWGIGAAVVMMLVALFPQIHLMGQRGREWHGANAITHPDEVAYSAYLAALVRGNARRYDPYTGSLAIFWFIALLTRDERFSAAVTAVVLTAALWWRSESRRFLTDRRLALIAIMALLFACGEVWLAASVSWNYNLAIDEWKPVADRLSQFGPAGPSPTTQVALMADLRLADRLPTDAPQAVLWAPHMLVFPGVTEAENRERFFQQLYYLGYNEKKFWGELDHPDWSFLAGILPYQRLSSVVSGSNEPLTPEELSAQVASYLEYSRTFNRDRAVSPTLSYLVVHAEKQSDYANLDRWYQRDAGERIGGFVLYRLKLRG